MSPKKHKSKETIKTTQQLSEKNAAADIHNNERLTRLTKGWLPYVLLFIFSFVLYGNTIKHQYALDDEVVICKNEAVLKGLSGTKDIFSKDLFASYYKQNKAAAQLSGGRYRPLSVFSFAVEQQFIGTRGVTVEDNAWDLNENGQQDAEEDVNHDGAFNYKDVYAKGFTLRHFDNILLYGLTCCVLFLFLSTVVFKERKLLAFIIALLFLAHPLHTEVVANVKSRDEILSFLFITLTLYLTHQYASQRTTKQLVFALLSFFCALLSKEYGALLFVFIPLSLYLFSEKPVDFKKQIGLFTGMVVLFGIYYWLRSGVVTGASAIQDKELLNNPYLLATSSQALATKLYIWFKYLLLCIFPYTLSSDYGYNSIPYKSFGDAGVWMGILTIAGMAVTGILALVKKNWMAFAVAIYGLTLLLVTNLLFNVGATMGERLAFHASLGYCMLLGAFLVWVTKNKNNGNLAFFITLPILLVYSIKTFSRNKAWENDDTLALTDVQTMPESALLNGNASRTYISYSELPENKGTEKWNLEKAVFHARKAIQLYPGMTTAYINLGLAYAKLNQFDSSKICLDKAFELSPNHPNKKAYYALLADALYQKGNSLGAQQKWQEGILFFNRAVALNPDVARYWYDLGGYLFNLKDFPNAKHAWEKAYQLNPKDPDIIKVQGIIK